MQSIKSGDAGNWWPLVDKQFQTYRKCYLESSSLGNRLAKKTLALLANDWGRLHDVAEAMRRDTSFRHLIKGQVKSADSDDEVQMKLSHLASSSCPRQYLDSCMDLTGAVTGIIGPGNMGSMEGYLRAKNRSSK